MNTKGNASCHLPNNKYRDNYDKIFKKEKPEMDDWVELTETCSICGGEMSWCSSCEMWNCFSCDEYGQCMCS